MLCGVLKLNISYTAVLKLRLHHDVLVNDPRGERGKIIYVS